MYSVAPRSVTTISGVSSRRTDQFLPGAKCRRPDGHWSPAPQDWIAIRRVVHRLPVHKVESIRYFSYRMILLPLQRFVFHPCSSTALHVEGQVDLEAFPKSYFGPEDNKNVHLTVNSSKCDHLQSGTSDLPVYRNKDS